MNQLGDPNLKSVSPTCNLNTAIYVNMLCFAAKVPGKYIKHSPFMVVKNCGFTIVKSTKYLNEVKWVAGSPYYGRVLFHLQETQFILGRKKGTP